MSNGHQGIRLEVQVHATQAEREIYYNLEAGMRVTVACSSLLSLTLRTPAYNTGSSSSALRSFFRVVHVLAFVHLRQQQCAVTRETAEFTVRLPGQQQATRATGKHNEIL